MLSSLLDPATAPLQYTQTCFFSAPFVFTSRSLPTISLWPSQVCSFWQQLQEAQFCPFSPSVETHDADLKAEIRALHWPWSNFLAVIPLLFGLYHMLQINQMFYFIFSSTSSAKLSSHHLVLLCTCFQPMVPCLFQCLIPLPTLKNSPIPKPAKKIVISCYNATYFAHVSVICVF